MEQDKEKWSAEEDKKDYSPPRSQTRAIGSRFSRRGENTLPCDANLVFKPKEDRMRKSSSETDQLRQQVNELESSLNENAKAAGEVYLRLLEIETSRGWKALQRVYYWREKLLPFGSRRRGVLNLLLRKWRQDVPSKNNAPAVEVTDPPHNVYQLWIRLKESPEQLQHLRRKCHHFSHQPKIGLLLSIDSALPEFLKQSIESIRSQIYGDWKLCLGGSKPTSKECAGLLDDYVKQDQRIYLVRGEGNGGTSQNTSEFFGQSEFVTFLEPGDTLAPDALYRIVEVLQKFPDAAAIYTDEDELDGNGNRSKPFFKPDWSPELLLSFNYIGRFVVVRRELVAEGDGIAGELNENRIYSLLLHMGKEGGRVHHICRALYHRRRGSPIMIQTDPHDSDARRQILESSNIPASVEAGLATGTFRVRYEITDNPKVTIIIATGGRVEFLRRCLESIFAKTGFRPYEIIVVDNSKGPDTQEMLAGLGRKDLSYADCRNRPFNFSALNNHAARQSSAPLILFLNDDTEVRSEDWLAAMVEHGQRPSVGVVGAKLLYPNGNIQHAGIVMGIHQSASNAFKNVPDNAREYYFGLPQVIRECSAVTAACMLTKRDLFLHLGGFNQRELAVSFQDPDYCLRVRQAGFAVIYTPYAVLTHHESTSKGFFVNPAEIRYLRKRWADVIAHDRYYNPNLTRTSEDYGLNFD
jgi:O-antigen biosynthesis protein